MNCQIPEKVYPEDFQYLKTGEAKDEKRHIWYFDASVYQQFRKASVNSKSSKTPKNTKDGSNFDKDKMLEENLAKIHNELAEIEQQKSDSWNIFPMSKTAYEEY